MSTKRTTAVNAPAALVHWRCAAEIATMMMKNKRKYAMAMADIFSVDRKSVSRYAMQQLMREVVQEMFEGGAEGAGQSDGAVAAELCAVCDIAHLLACPQDLQKHPLSFL